MKTTSKMIPISIIKNQLTTVGNNISKINLAKGSQGFKAVGKKQWQIGYLTALSDVLNWLEKEYPEE